MKDENICGRFYRQQLTTAISDKPVSNFFRRLKFTAIAFTTLLGFKTFFADKASAQTFKFSDDKKSQSTYSLSKLINRDTSKIIIDGKLKDKETNEAIPFANIVIREGENVLGFGECDDNGNFHIELPKEKYSFTKVEISVRYLGYETLKIQDLPIDTSSFYLDLSMMSNTPILGEVVVGYTVMININEPTKGSVLTKEEIRHLPK